MDTVWRFAGKQPVPRGTVGSEDGHLTGGIGRKLSPLDPLAEQVAQGVVPGFDEAIQEQLPRSGIVLSMSHQAAQRGIRQLKSDERHFEEADDCLLP